MKGVVTLSFSRGFTAKGIPAHQHDDLHTIFSPLNQNTSAWEEDYTAIYDESDSSSDHEQGEEFLSQESPKYSQVEERVVLNEAYVSNPLDQVLFQDPFVVFLEKSKGVVCSTQNSLLQRLKKILGTTVRKQAKWKWPFHFFSTVKKLKLNPSWNHLLDWLCWKRYFTK